MWRVTVAGVISVAAWLGVGAAAAGAQADPATTFLQTQFLFSASDLRDVAQGRARARALDTIDGREVAIVGAVRVAVSPADYVRQLRDIVTFKRHEAVRQIGTFGSPPQAQDIAALTLDGEHLTDLRNCRVHDCDLQLSRAAIERVRREVGWSSPQAPEQASRLMREILTDLTARYVRSGDAALMTYEDDAKPLSVAAEFRDMIAAPPAVMQRFPALEQHVTRFPMTRAPAAEDVIYWSKEDVGPKVIVSVTHLAIVPVHDNAVAFAAASKQLYGSSYFDASLGLTLLLRDQHPSSTLLVYVNRSRVDVLGGLLGGLKRAVVRSRARAAMVDTLTGIQARLRTRGAALRRPDAFARSVTSQRD
jgi:hypothetical protein